jgi:trk system potassium uptake protein TrkH
MNWKGIPVAALLVFALAALMLPPAILAALEGDWPSARIFAQHAGMAGLASVGLGLALAGARGRVVARAEILTVLLFFTLGPLVAAMPLQALVPALRLDGAYFEMVSTFTTTGATALSEYNAIPRAVHLWRAMTAWLGGFVTLVAAAAVFAPRNLGGYEVQISQRQGAVGRLSGGPAWSGAHERVGSGTRVASAVRAVAPAYVLLTVIAAVLFAATGQSGLHAVVHAVGMISTSGLVIDNSGFRAGGGWAAEAIAVAFMGVAATRHMFVAGSVRARLRRFRGDPEIELAAIAVGIAAGWIFLRHWLGAAEFHQATTLSSALDAIWGAAFTCFSFLTTTGYVSADWEDARAWSGVTGPGMLLLGLAAMGGGVASTAGGIKLLRSFALFQYGLRDMALLAHPNAVLAQGQGKYRVGFAGAMLAWLFVMLFMLAMAVATLGLAATGMPLESSLAAAIAGLSNTGPAYEIALGREVAGFDAFGPAARLILCGAMVLGRVETLAVVALCNPSYWRR